MEFVEWLIKTKKLKVRSSRDVKSRLNRLLKINDRVHSMKADSIVKIVNELSDSPSVRSQLKRAVELFQEYKGKKE